MAELPEGIIEGDLGHTSHHNTLHALVERLDNQAGTGPFPFTAAGYKTGTLAARPVADATNEEFYYYAYDTQQLFISYGNAWVELTGGGSTATPQWANVKDFGAVGNGTTDDHAAIVAAQASLPPFSSNAYGGVLYFPTGTYLVSAPIQVLNGVHVLGDGPTASTIKAGNTFNAANLVTNADHTGGQEFFFLSGMLLNGNKGGGAVMSVATLDLVSIFVNTFVRDVVIGDSPKVGYRIAAAQALGPVLTENVWVAGSNDDNVLVEEVAGNTNAISNIVFNSLTVEHQASGKVGLHVKGLGRIFGVSVTNLHIEQANTGTGTVAVLIDGATNVRLKSVNLQKGNAGAVSGIVITNHASNNAIIIEQVSNINLIDPVIDDQLGISQLHAVNVPYYATTDVGIFPNKQQDLIAAPIVLTDINLGNYCLINTISPAAFTIANPTNSRPGQILTYEIGNFSGAPIVSITWGSDFAYLDGTFVSPANGRRRTISFRKQISGSWIQLGPSSLDM